MTKDQIFICFSCGLWQPPSLFHICYSCGGQLIHRFINGHPIPLKEVSK